MATETKGLVICWNDAEKLDDDSKPFLVAFKKRLEAAGYDLTSSVCDVTFGYGFRWKEDRGEKGYTEATVTISDGKAVVDRIKLEFEEVWEVPSTEPDRLAILLVNAMNKSTKLAAVARRYHLPKRSATGRIPCAPTICFGTAAARSRKRRISSSSDDARARLPAGRLGSLREDWRKLTTHGTPDSVNDHDLLRDRVVQMELRTRQQDSAKLEAGNAGIDSRRFRKLVRVESGLPRARHRKDPHRTGWIATTGTPHWLARVRRRKTRRERSTSCAELGQHRGRRCPFAGPMLCDRPCKRRVELGALFVVETILFIGHDELDLAALRQVDRLIQNEPPAANTGAKRERHVENIAHARGQECFEQGVLTPNGPSRTCGA